MFLCVREREEGEYECLRSCLCVGVGFYYPGWIDGRMLVSTLLTWQLDLATWRHGGEGLDSWNGKKSNNYPPFPIARRVESPLVPALAIGLCLVTLCQNNFSQNLLPLSLPDGVSGWTNSGSGGASWLRHAAGCNAFMEKRVENIAIFCTKAWKDEFSSGGSWRPRAVPVRNVPPTDAVPETSKTGLEQIALWQLGLP